MGSWGAGGAESLIRAWGWGWRADGGSENQEVGVLEDKSHIFGSEEGYWRALAPFSHFTDVETEALNQGVGQGHKNGHDGME